MQSENTHWPRHDVVMLSPKPHNYVVLGSFLGHIFCGPPDAARHHMEVRSC